MATSEVLEFEDEGLFSMIISQTENIVHFRINVINEEEFQRWKELFMQRNKTTLNVKRVYPRTPSKFSTRNSFVCMVLFATLGRRRRTLGMY